MMPPCGTFRYVATVPPESKRESPWPVELAEKIQHMGNKLTDSRLVGHHPTLAVTDYAPALPSNGKPIKLPFARLTLNASGTGDATVSSASFWVDKRMLSVFQGGDWLYLTRTACAGLGISLLRRNRLVFAAGAITAVPLENVSAGCPSNLIEEAAQPFRKLDPAFHFRDHPLLFTIEGATRVLLGGSATLGGYEITVHHGARFGVPGENESAAITDSACCKHAFALFTAEAFDLSTFEMSE